jgi:predicted MFS family arabinose efflux permease
MTGARTSAGTVWRVVLIGALLVFVTLGLRQTFGVFLKPVTEELGIGREPFSLALAIQNFVMGIPLAGFAADRFGPRRVAIAGGLLLAACIYGFAEIGSAGLILYGLIGFGAGIALSATGLVVVLGAVGKVVPENRQSFYFGIITAATSLGIFVMVYLSGRTLEIVGWRPSVRMLAVAVLAVTALAATLPAGHGASAHRSERLITVLSRALANRSYVLLTVGFFVCGFHVAFIGSHLVPFLTDEGLTDSTAAFALALIGLFNVFGSFGFGWLGDRYRKRTLLSILYGLRAVVISLFLLGPINSTTAAIFGATIGLLWLATVPLTSGTVSSIFGTRHLASLYGIVFFSHQIGAFLGVWLGGRAFDLGGSYTPVWIAAVVLGVVASLIHLPIDERRVEIVASAS